MSAADASGTRVAGHFHDAGQQREAAVLGMWAFLATEVMFFGGLFAGYLLLRLSDPTGFAAAAGNLDLWFGALNTAVLLASSYTVALAVHAIQAGRARRSAWLLAASAALGLFFLVIKGLEYAEKIEHGLVPGLLWHPQEALGDIGQLFFFLYFVMTGLHGVHVVIGIGLLAWVAANAARGRYGADSHDAVECVGLYWHFVDLVWIYLFPLFYLIGAGFS